MIPGSSQSSSVKLKKTRSFYATRKIVANRGDVRVLEVIKSRDRFKLPRLRHIKSDTNEN